MKRDLPVMAMELTVLLAFVILIDTAMPHDLPLLPALACYPLAYLLAPLLPRGNTAGANTLLAGGIIVAGLAMIGLVLLLGATLGEGVSGRAIGRFAWAAAIAIIAWARGWQRARTPIEPRDVVGSFQFGLGLMVLTLFVQSGLGVPWQEQAALALAFVVFGLVSLAMARGSRLSVGTAIALVFGLSAVLGVAALIVLVINRGTVATGLAGGASVFDAVFVRFPAFLISLFPEFVPEKQPKPRYRIEGFGDERVMTMPEPGGSAVVLWILAGLLAFGLAIILVRFLINLMREMRVGRASPGLTYGRAGNFSSLLKALLRALAAMVTRTGLRLRTIVVALRPKPVDASVGGRYRQLLRRLAFRGKRKQAGETPLEYYRRIAPAWPKGSDDFGRLTDAFVAERYGGEAARPEVVEALWRRLRPQTRRIRKAHG